MTLAETVKDHPAIVIALAAISSYGAGWASSKAVAETGNQVQVVRGDLERLQKAENELKECLKVRRCPATGPVLLPPGEDIGFFNSFIVSSSLVKRAIRGEDRDWEKKCRAVGAQALTDMGFKLVEVQSERAVRGELEAVHLGIDCRSEWSAVVLYGAVSRDRSLRLTSAAETLEAKLEALRN